MTSQGPFSSQARAQTAVQVSCARAGSLAGCVGGGFSQPSRLLGAQHPPRSVKLQVETGGKDHLFGTHNGSIPAQGLETRGAASLLARVSPISSSKPAEAWSTRIMTGRKGDTAAGSFIPHLETEIRHLTWSGRRLSRSVRVARGWTWSPELKLSPRRSEKYLHVSCCCPSNASEALHSARHCTYVCQDALGVSSKLTISTKFLHDAKQADRPRRAAVKTAHQ